MLRLESKVEKQLRERILKNFLDVVILSRLEKSEPMGGYDFIRLIHEEFGILISTGTIYSNLYALERKGFVKSYLSRKRRVYKIVDKGRQFVEAASHAMKSVQNWIEKMMKARIS